MTGRYVGGWLFHRAKDQSKEEEPAFGGSNNEKSLQNQLQVEQSSQQVSEDVPSTEKKKKRKRKSHENRGDDLDEGERERKKKKKKKKKLAEKERLAQLERENSINGAEILDNALADVLAEVDNTVANPASESNQIWSRPPSNGPPSSQQLPYINDKSASSSSDDEPGDRSYLVSQQPNGEATASSSLDKSPTGPGTTPKPALKDATPSSSNRRASFRSSPALMKTIMKDSKKSSTSQPPITSERPILPPKRKSTSMIPAPPPKTPREKIPGFSEPKLTTNKSPAEATPRMIVPIASGSSSYNADRKDGDKDEPEDDASVFSGNQGESSAESEPEEKPTPTVKDKSKAKQNTKKASRASHSWKFASCIPPMLPSHYKPGDKNSQKRYHCPVDICGKGFTRKTTMAQHMNISHVGAVYEDNMDGTLRIVRTDNSKPDSSSGSEEEDVSAGSPPKVSSANSTPIKKTPAKKTSQKPEESQTNSDTDPNPPQASEKKKRGRPVGSKNSEPSSIAGKGKGRRKSEKVTSDDHDVTKPVDSGPPPRSSRSESVMEPWELEPGRIFGPNKSNIAFSNPYLSAQPHGIELTDSSTRFTVFHFPGGAKHMSTADETTLRICSVAVGKVQVAIGGKEFTIGPHGMWQIKPGQICEINNRHYTEAVVHVCAIEQDDE